MLNVIIDNKFNTKYITHLKGFKFVVSGLDGLNYNPKMDNYIDKLGKIIYYDKNRVTLSFDDGDTWSYPIDEALKQVRVENVVELYYEVY
jgi:hypothetical protein